MMESKTCKNCRHFRQHYVRSGGRYMPLDCGHCVHPRLKDRNCQTPACSRYSRRPEQ